jgi:lysine biosynthesis protein LysW
MFDGDISPGEIVSCPDCGLDLEVKGMQGREAELQILPIEREDWGE